jgi:hypothetical protein
VAIQVLVKTDFVVLNNVLMVENTAKTKLIHALIDVPKILFAGAQSLGEIGDCLSTFMFFTLFSVLDDLLAEDLIRLLALDSVDGTLATALDFFENLDFIGVVLLVIIHLVIFTEQFLSLSSILGVLDILDYRSQFRNFHSFN